jgi:hypothetical protein
MSTIIIVLLIYTCHTIFWNLFLNLILKILKNLWSRWISRGCFVCCRGAWMLDSRLAEVSPLSREWHVSPSFYLHLETKGQRVLHLFIVRSHPLWNPVVRHSDATARRQHKLLLLPSNLRASSSYISAKRMTKKAFPFHSSNSLRHWHLSITLRVLIDLLSLCTFPSWTGP